MTSAVLAALPSPPQGVWQLGPLPVRAYALAILLGGVAAWWILDRRYTAKGGPKDTAIDVVFWMVPFGIVGARLYHVVTTPEPYFGPGGNPWNAFAIWNGGLGIWGAVALGAVGAWLGLRRRGLRLAPFADALAPGLLVAQAIGRLGNYFNQELYGKATTLPWGLRIDDAHLVPGYPSGTLFHPTFLYELVWNLAMVGVLVWAERRFRLGHGRVFWLYVMLYTLGRVWIEYLRIDTAEIVLGLRLNVWTSILIFLVALAFFVVIGRRTRGVPESLWLPGREPVEGTVAGTDDGQEPTSTVTVAAEPAPVPGAEVDGQVAGAPGGARAPGEEHAPSASADEDVPSASADEDVSGRG
ncbi:prolipoprotein diacylglyceryl transferase [Georgenia ruanii]|uniref:Phosphatidylglycerol--prolipoprotein diacylglyceryl transferase n=1 Tax=Georgenia ruanii TaxID=348442 RepID=A0A7J9V1X5_9MICO|nr:prolipoprotein diacylglyceryl transferase [Georgenia ruanii]MPV90130.1 prolipoprotein diacylglyceryl transferase [Georgenia ruanii]